MAFTQCLWRLLRMQFIKISSVEVLFSVARNPLLLYHLELLILTPTICLLVLFMWLLPIAVTFPPGALVVVPAHTSSVQVRDVPTYNASFIGNSSVTDSSAKALAIVRGASSMLVYTYVPSDFLSIPSR
jgi:hypothetical protein